MSAGIVRILLNAEADVEPRLWLVPEVIVEKIFFNRPIAGYPSIMCAILFIGEALTGNDSFDQLTKFNQALIDHSKKDNPRTIDGILLTKFDASINKIIFILLIF